MTGSPWRPWERFFPRRPERRLGDLMAELEIPPEVRQQIFRQGRAVPAFLPRHKYGAGNTIHQTGTIDVDVDWENRRVVAVWFRCRTLPFTFSTYLAGDVPQPHIAIEEITYVELGSSPCDDLSRSPWR